MDYHSSVVYNPSSTFFKLRFSIYCMCSRSLTMHIFYYYSIFILALNIDIQLNSFFFFLVFRLINDLFQVSSACMLIRYLDSELSSLISLLDVLEESPDNVTAHFANFLELTTGKTVLEAFQSRTLFESESTLNFCLYGPYYWTFCFSKIRFKCRGN